MTFFAQAATPNPRMKKRVPNPSENTATLQQFNTVMDLRLYPPPKKRKKVAKKERGDIYPYGVIYIPPKTNTNKYSHKTGQLGQLYRTVLL